MDQAPLKRMDSAAAKAHADKHMEKYKEMDVTQLVFSSLPFIGILVIDGFIIYYAKTYGSTWGDHGKRCDDRFPTFVLVMAAVQCVIFGFVMLVFIGLRLGVTISNVAVLSMMCCMCPAVCFLLPWGISTWVFFFSSNETCGPELYKIFWLSVVVGFASNCCIECLKGCFIKHPQEETATSTSTPISSEVVMTPATV